VTGPTALVLNADISECMGQLLKEQWGQAGCEGLPQYHPRPGARRDRAAQDRRPRHDVPQRGATDNIVPETIVPVLPVLFHSEDHVHAVLDGPISNETLTAMEKANMVGLAFYESGARSMYTTRPIRTLADIQHRKIRVQQSDLRGREALHADRALDGARGAGVLQMDLEPPAGRGPSAGPPSGQGLGPAHAQAL
jgi:hypothetical protein